MLDFLMMYSTINTANPPKWATSLHQQSNLVAAQNAEDKQLVSSPPQHQPRNFKLAANNTDEHFSRHLDNLVEKSLVCEKDEPQEASNVKMGAEQDEEEEHEYDEPKAFQVEDVDLPPLVTKTSPKPTSSKVEKLVFNKVLTVTKNNLMPKVGTQLELKSTKREITTLSTKLEEIPLNAEINLTSTMATPMHYFSRSTSMSSLNSFDIKSIHSEVASEYSQVTSQVTSPSYKNRREGEFNHSDYLDDLENLNMPDSPSAMENSFLNAQRYIHKQQQHIYRQNAVAAMSSVANHQAPVLVSTMNFQMNKIVENPNLFNDNIKILKNELNFNQITNCQQINKVVKPWNFNTQTVTTLIQKPSQTNDLNLIMQRLNIKQTDKATAAVATKPNIDSESDSDTASDSSDSLSFLNENKNKNQKDNKVPMPNKLANQKDSLNVIHTPPVKLQAQSKFIQTQPKASAIEAESVNTTSTIVTNQFNTNVAPAMSVSYAFMKNSFSQFAPSSFPNGQPQQTVPAPQMPQFMYQPPKFLQNSNQPYQTYQNPLPPLQFSQNPFPQPNSKPPIIQPQQSYSSSPSSSSTNPKVNNNVELSPTNSDAPYVYMVEKTSNILTPQAPKTRSIFPENDRPPSPQESVCSMMSDSSIPSIIRQDISRTAIGFQQVKQQPQHEFQALFNKLNNKNQYQNNDTTITESNQQMMPQAQPAFFSYDPKPQNNLMPAFNFLKSAPAFNQGYFSNQNTPTNMNMNPNANYSDLDCTYSPKVFRNEGTGSRYDSEDEDPIEEPAAARAANFMQNSTQLKKVSSSEQTDDQSDELLLENFIKENLGKAKSPEKTATRPRMSSSVSSEAPFAQLSNKTKFRNSGSSSSLNNISVKSHLSLKNDKLFASKQHAQKPLANKSSTPTATKTNAIATKSTSKPKQAAANNTSIAAKATITKKPTLTTSNKSLNKIPSTAPVVNMTKTAQLRMAKIQTTQANASASGSSENNLNSTLTSMQNPAKKPYRPKPTPTSSANSVRSNRPSAKENMNSKETANCVQVNPHLDHLNRGIHRRNSLSSYSQTQSNQSVNKRKRADADTSISSASDTSLVGAAAPKVTAAKPRSTWK